MHFATAFSSAASTEELEAKSLSGLAREWASRPVQRMRHALGDAFFLHLGGIEGTRQSQGFLRTLSYEPGANEAAGSVLAGGCVYAVRATGRCPFPNFVSIGRTRNNDVVLPDLSISKFHAYLRPENGHYTIQDAGSQNGTWVAGQRLTTKQSTILLPQVSFRLGALDLTYLDAAELHAFLARV